MKNISSKQAKAKTIPPKVKDAVRVRDDGLCVWCGKPGLPEAHFISRKRGGLGIEENILTLCRECHERFDHGTAQDRERMRVFFRRYLEINYPHWDELKLYYKKEQK